MQHYALAPKTEITTKHFIQSFHLHSDNTVLLSYLSEEELEKVTQITHTKKQQAYIIAHAFTRILLTLTAKEHITPKEWHIKKNHRGKPYVDEAIFFNISYAEDLCTIAVSLEAEIGIDLAVYRPIASDDLPWFVLHPNEKTYLEAQVAEDRYRHFLEMWTVKEAVSKALGLGFSLEFHTIDSTLMTIRYNQKYFRVIHEDLIINQSRYHWCLAYIYTK